MEPTTRKTILLKLHDEHLESLTRNEVVLETLKGLPQEMILKPHRAAEMGIEMPNVTVAQRVVEVMEDIKIGQARLQAVKKLLEQEEKAPPARAELEQG